MIAPWTHTHVVAAVLFVVVVVVDDDNVFPTFSVICHNPTLASRRGNEMLNYCRDENQGTDRSGDKGKGAPAM